MAEPTLMPDGNAKPTHVGNYAHITSTAASQVKTGAGFLYSVAINTATGIGTLSLYDSATGTANPIALIAPTGPTPLDMHYDVQFTNGLHVIPGGAAQDITISYR